jgi:hypothetical protein
MRIEREEYVMHSADRVFPLMRDRLQDLLPHLPNVESIEVLSRKQEAAGKTRVKSRWKVRAPALLGRLLPAAALVWEEDALWIDKKYCVESRISGPGYESRGRTFFEPASDYTRVRVEAEVTFRPEAIDLPKESVEKILTGAEQALREAVESNMAALVEAIRERLDG